MEQKNVLEKSHKQEKTDKSCKKILGPVQNLEDHVSPDWWRKIFNSLYLKTDGDVVEDRTITSQEIELFVEILNPSPDSKILDLCCGQGRHSIELARKGFANVEGLDRSHYLIQKAKEIIKKEGISVKFKEGDARKLPYQPDTFDIIMILGNSFGYFETVQDDFRVLKEVFRTLKPWGKLLLDIADGDYLKKHFQPRSWEWISKEYFVCRERSLSYDKQRLISREIISHTQKGVIADQFYSERLYSKDGIAKLLNEVGFHTVDFNCNLRPDSKRNQDLGMMERRIVVTATVKKEWAPQRKKRGEENKNVVIVFGDPKKPDLLKPYSVFDDDDFYTIDQLKGALRELKGYNWKYLDNHDTLMDDLKKMKGKIDYVFNLCDEGYYNDARKELHVPSLFEAIGINYTGAGPQCLAYCYDKSLVRGIAKEMGIPVPEAFFIKPEDVKFEIQVEFPVIVKPNFGDSSFGITQNSVCFDHEKLLIAISEIREKFGYDKPILVEEFLTGKDISVGIIGNPPENYKALPIIEEDYSALPEELPRICGYEAKWQPDSPYWQIKSIPAVIADETKEFLVEYCIKLWERLECRDYTRFDWRLDKDGNPKLLEVNPNPGWCWDGHLAKMSKIDGISYVKMLEAILQSAELRLGITVPEGKNENK